MWFNCNLRRKFPENFVVMRIVSKFCRIGIRAEWVRKSFCVGECIRKNFNKVKSLRVICNFRSKRVLLISREQNELENLGYRLKLTDSENSHSGNFQLLLSPRGMYFSTRRFLSFQILFFFSLFVTVQTASLAIISSCCLNWFSWSSNFSTKTSTCGQ